MENTAQDAKATLICVDTGETTEVETINSMTTFVKDGETSWTMLRVIDVTFAMKDSGPNEIMILRCGSPWTVRTRGFIFPEETKPGESPIEKFIEVFQLHGNPAYRIPAGARDDLWAASIGYTDWLSSLADAGQLGHPTTALSVAAECNHVSAARLLLERGADPDPSFIVTLARMSEDMIRAFVLHAPRLDQHNSAGEDVFQILARREFKGIETLLAAGADAKKTKQWVRRKCPLVKAWCDGSHPTPASHAAAFEALADPDVFDEIQLAHICCDFIMITPERRVHHEREKRREREAKVAELKGRKRPRDE